MSETHKKQGNFKGYIKQLEDFLELYLVKKAPALPKGGREFIVKIAPWLVIVGVVMTVPSIITIFGLTSMATQLPYGAAVAGALGPIYYLTILLYLAVIIIEIIALPGLFARKKSGWDLIFYASLVSAVSSLISMNLGAFIIGTLLSLYLLFQVREYYK